MVLIKLELLLLGIVSVQAGGLLLGPRKSAR